MMFSAASAATAQMRYRPKRCHDTRIVGDAPPDANRGFRTARCGGRYGGVSGDVSLGLGGGAKLLVGGYAPNHIAAAARASGPGGR
jgi:hypothetical protein